MGEFSNVKKVCGFYVSSMHLITMILPYIKKETNKDVKIETILEYNLKENVNNVVANLIINDKEKENILNINWNSNNKHIIAEVFAATKTSSNNKLKEDIKALCSPKNNEDDVIQRYVFFFRILCHIEKSAYLCTRKKEIARFSWKFG